MSTPLLVFSKELKPISKLLIRERKPIKCHLSPKAGLRSWSQEKQDSETGPILRHGEAKAIRRRSL